MSKSAVGRRQNTGIAVEQADPQRSLDTRNAPRDRALIDAKVPRRAGDTARARQAENVT